MCEPILPLYLSVFLTLICALSYLQLILLNNGETECSSHAVTQPVESREYEVNTYVCARLSLCMLKISLQGTYTHIYSS